MVGIEISEVVKSRVIRDILYTGMNQREAAVKEDISLESVNTIWKEFDAETLNNGVVATLEAKVMPDAVQLANLGRDMRRRDITPIDCARTLPLVAKCASLDMDPTRIGDMIDSALRLAQPGFPVSEYANAVARIYRREKETGLTIEQVDATHQTLTVGVQSLRTEQGNLQTSLPILRAQSTGLTEEISVKQKRVNAVNAEVERAGVTEAQLATYMEDRERFGTVVDIRDVTKVSTIIWNFQLLNFNAHAIVNAILQIGNLQSTLRKLTDDLGIRQNELQTAERGIQTLEGQRKAEEDTVTETKLKAAQSIQATRREVAEVRQEADRKIMNINAQVLNAFNNANTTRQEVEDFTASREKLRKWGVNI